MRTASPRWGWLPAMLGVLLIVAWSAGVGVIGLGTVAAQEAPTVTAGTKGQDPSAGVGDPLEASTRTVNVELILDASGSMAEDLSNTENQSRMDAAKAAMREVIEGIPEQEGLNVGFRIYGHEGSNSEADKAVSCRSTELLVPIAGVDKEALREQVDSFEPTGWTPLARALEAAAEDFAPGGESVTNAVIMVTDGEETCGGDPCAVAAQLHAADVELVTHVVGFALPPEQQDAVRCIAEEGGGNLFTAEDAAELSEAVFSALQQLETTEAGYVGGNAFSLLDAGEAGELSVIAVGPYDGLYLPIVTRNNTGADVESVEVAVRARDGAGDLIATGDDNLSIRPNVVVDGGVAIGAIYFGNDDLPEDAAFEFELAAEPAGDDEFESRRDLVVEEVNLDGEQILGILRNDHEEEIGIPVQAAVVCFDDAGALSEFGQGQVDRQTIASGDTSTFSFGVPSAVTGLEGPCPAFLVAGGGAAAP